MILRIIQTVEFLFLTCKGVNATLLAVPDAAPLTDDFPPNTAVLIWR
jgi:hypothetical protein